MNRINNVVWIAAFFVVMGLVVGCGGGGGGTTSGGSNGSTNGNTTNSGTTSGTYPGAGQFVELVVTGTQTADPMNLSTSSNYSVKFVNYDTFGTRTVLPVSNYSITGAAGHMTLSSSGQLSTFTATTNKATISVTGTVAGQVKTLTQDVFIPGTTQSATVSGRLLSTDGTTPVTRVQVELYDGNGAFVGGGQTGNTGYFAAKVKPGVNNLTIKAETISSTYYKAMKYQNKNYAISGLTCLLGLPNVSSGGTYVMPAAIYIPRQLDGPPPPPNGCQ